MNGGIAVFWLALVGVVLLALAALGALVAAGWLYLIHIQVEEIARQLEIASDHAVQPTNNKEVDVPVPFQRR